ncbi:MAG: hypothetical protein LCI00_00590 [Chloroflexi bacterium]|nr:hypothetical protein [Chloroflexota bacterium]MCC6896927.1 hypothetical protein [Anaerolineae bacterium]
MPANVDGMVREGISAYRAGNKEEARTLLLRAVEIDQYNEQAWLWLSAVVETPEEQRTCLENVLTINPNSERAKQGIDMLDQRFGSSPKVSPTQADDVMASTSFMPPPAPLPRPSSDDELPSSIEWEVPATASSSASSNFKVNEPSEKEYDDWVSKLNIGGGAISEGMLDEANRFMSITDDDDEERFDPNAVDDIFSSGPFSADLSTQTMPKPEPIKAQSPLRQSPTPEAPLKSAAPMPKATKPASTPSVENRVFAGLDDDDDLSMGALVEDFDDAVMEKLEADEFFQYIPKEIKATRLPGTSERYPLVAIIGLLVLVLANIGALAFFIQNMTAP